MVADIAEAAEVSPRTVAMYFPAKQHIALSRFSDGVASLTDAIRARRPGETLHQVFGRWLLTSQTEPEDRELHRLARRMFAANPDLGPCARRGWRPRCPGAGFMPRGAGPNP